LALIPEQLVPLTQIITHQVKKNQLAAAGVTSKMFGMLKRQM